MSLSCARHWPGIPRARRCWGEEPDGDRHVLVSPLVRWWLITLQGPPSHGIRKAGEGLQDLQVLRNGSGLEQPVRITFPKLTIDVSKFVDIVEVNLGTFFVGFFFFAFYFLHLQLNVSSSILLAVMDVLPSFLSSGVKSRESSAPDLPRCCSPALSHIYQCNETAACCLH